MDTAGGCIVQDADAQFEGEGRRDPDLEEGPDNGGGEKNPSGQAVGATTARLPIHYFFNKTCMFMMRQLRTTSRHGRGIPSQLKYHTALVDPPNIKRYGIFFNRYQANAPAGRRIGARI